MRAEGVSQIYEGNSSVLGLTVWLLLIYVKTFSLEKQLVHSYYLAILQLGSLH